MGSNFAWVTALVVKFHFHYPNRTSVGLGQDFNDGMSFPATKANHELSTQTSAYCIFCRLNLLLIAIT